MYGLKGRKLAATVLLLRDGEQGLEVYVQERTHTMPTFPSTTVFPGGGVDPRDFDISRPHLWAGPDSGDFAELLGVDRARARALLFAAVRETFEESGLLIALDNQGQPVADASIYHRDRQAMEAHLLPMFTFLEEHGLQVNTHALRPFARWAGPPTLPVDKQFDTFSFITRAPSGQEPDDVSTRETTSAGWFTPRVILQGFETGLLNLVLPTWSQLMRLADCDSVEDVFAQPVNYPLEIESDTDQDPRYQPYYRAKAARGPRRF